MKAAVITGAGKNQKLSLKDVQRPVSNTGTSIIKVEYCGINHLDLLIKTGKRPGPTSFPHILGSEIVGEVVNTDSTYSGLYKGDKVAVYPWIFDGYCDQCEDGRENICQHMATIGRNTPGGYAEYVEVPTRNLVKLPPNANLAEICSIVLAGTTAVHLTKRAQVQPLSTVLITGASGGVGTLLIQLLKQIGCTIICSTGNPTNKKKLMAYGADYMITSNKIEEQVLTRYPNGIDYVFDLVGGKTWTASVKVLGKGGTLVFCATTDDAPGEINLGQAFAKEVNIVGSYGGTLTDLEDLVGKYTNGEITSVIDTIYMLEEVNEAHSRLQKREVFGKLILRL